MKARTQQRGLDVIGQAFLQPQGRERQIARLSSARRSSAHCHGTEQRVATMRCDEASGNGLEVVLRRSWNVSFQGRMAPLSHMCACAGPRKCQRRFLRIFPNWSPGTLGVTLSACRRAVDDPVQFLRDAVKPEEVLPEIAIWSPTMTPRAGAIAFGLFASVAHDRLAR